MNVPITVFHHHAFAIFVWVTSDQIDQWSHGDVFVKFTHKMRKLELRNQDLRNKSYGPEMRRYSLFWGTCQEMRQFVAPSDLGAIPKLHDFNSGASKTVKWSVDLPQGSRTGRFCIDQRLNEKQLQECAFAGPM